MGPTAHARRQGGSGADPARRDAIAAEVSRMHASEVFCRCRRDLQAIALVTGYTRPRAVVQAWQRQAKAFMPGDVRDYPVAAADSVQRQLAEAMDMEHPLDSMSVGLPDDIHATAAWQVKAGSGAHVGRQGRMAVVRRCSDALDGWTRRLRLLAPQHIKESKPPVPHYALFECARMAVGMPDDGLVVDLVAGAPCVGDIPDSGLFKADEQPALLSMEDLSHGGLVR